MALLNEIPQSVREKKLYDEDEQFTDKDLTDVLQGLLKLGVSGGANHDNVHLSNPRCYPRSTANGTSSLNNSFHSVSSSSSSRRHSPQRHHSASSPPVSFLASSRTIRRQQQQQNGVFDSMKLLMAAVNTVERKDVFKIDKADIDRITNNHTTIYDMRDEIEYDSESGVIRMKSKTAIKVPDVDEEQRITFQHLNDDFTPKRGTKRDSLLSIPSRRDSDVQSNKRFSNISSIGRRSSIGLWNIQENEVCLNESTNSKQNLNESAIDQEFQQKQENRRREREWSEQAIKEIDELYHNKTKLATKQQFEEQTDTNSSHHKRSELRLSNASEAVAAEFSDTNQELTKLTKEHEQGLQNALSSHETYTRQLEKQNEHFEQRLLEMEQKVKRYEEEQENMRKAIEAQNQKRLQQQQQQQQKQQQLQQQQPPPPKPRPPPTQPPAAPKPSQQQEPGAKSTINPSPPLSDTQPGQTQVDDSKEWYRYEAHLHQISKHYKAMYKKLEAMMDEFDKRDANLLGDLEMKVGLIVRSVASNRKSVFDAYKRFQSLINERTKPQSPERQYCFIQITNEIICDTRIVRHSAQKFASAYFLSFIMSEFEREYLEIFKCCFHQQCVWTIPYINKQLRTAEASKPSIARCVVLGYRNVKNVGNVASEKRKFLQKFTKTNGAGEVYFEAEDTYFTRMRHVCGLFAAFMAIRNMGKFRNPFGIDSQHCWKWMVYLLGLPQCVYPELCSILSGVVEIVGHDMLEMYPRQFPKLLQYVHQHIYQHADESTSIRGKARRELNLFLRQCRDSMQKNQGKLVIEKPKESKLIEKSLGARELGQGEYQ
eukprot:CAMPEP_0197038606 /NCGR_PEP_ID=MMETSP1384-20130603/15518_1 /TAXON_ID=29189 /ORGANISM="Ammonia sp." /LENGTH=823 /DNA_ID=CAMNT_0042469063 /DNA_START=41 /DNA_END=2512 /DNA_ORIENTATION=+